MLSLYPDISCYHSFHLPVDDLHSLYVEQSGNPDGIPVLFVHGGPGAGCSRRHRCFFDPEKYRIILFDQRGCGRSTPHAELRENTTEHLINDIEKIRQELAIEQWMLFGGSWGSTLSLLYAQQFPARVSAMVLRGIFLCRDQDVRWFYQHGASRIFAEDWQDFIRPIAQSERDDLLVAYHRLLTGDNELLRMGAAKAWSRWEGRCATLMPNDSLVDAFTSPHQALALARIEAHYFVNNGFIKPNQILANMAEIEAIPSVIVHGRYDMVCPLDNALSLHQAWPDSQLQVIAAAGHAASEPAITDALVRATIAMAGRLNDTK